MQTFAQLWWFHIIARREPYEFGWYRKKIPKPVEGLVASGLIKKASWKRAYYFSLTKKGRRWREEIIRGQLSQWYSSEERDRVMLGAADRLLRLAVSEKDVAATIDAAFAQLSSEERKKLVGNEG